MLQLDHCYTKKQQKYISQKNIVWLLILVSSFKLCLLSSCRHKDKQETIYQFRNKLLSETVDQEVNSLKVDTSVKAHKITLPKDLDAVFKLSSVIEEVSYLKLGEVPDDLMTDMVPKIRSHGDKYFLLDDKKGGVYVFDDSGTFQYSKLGTGDGPAEFRKASTFALDIFHDELAIFDDKLSKILYYSMDGTFLREKFIGFRLEDFDFLTDSTIAVTLGKTYNDHLPEIRNNQLAIVDREWKVIATGGAYNADKERGVYFTGQTLRRFSGQLSYFQPFTSTIYEIAGDSLLYPRYELDFGQLALPEDLDFSMGLDKFLKKYKSPEFAFMVSNGLELENTILFNVNHNGRLSYIFYDKNSNGTVYGAKYINDIGALGFFNPTHQIAEKDILISVISSEVVASIDKRDINEFDLPGNLIELFEETEASDYPVLLFYKLKAIETF
jgi:hypothetical protein